MWAVANVPTKPGEVAAQCRRSRAYSRSHAPVLTAASSVLRLLRPAAPALPPSLPRRFHLLHLMPITSLPSSTHAICEINRKLIATFLIAFSICFQLMWGCARGCEARIALASVGF